MGKNHRRRIGSKKKSKSKVNEVDVLGSFQFEDSPRSYSSAFCVSNHNQKGLFFIDSPCNLEAEVSSNHVAQEQDGGDEEAGLILVHGEATVSKNELDVSSHASGGSLEGSVDVPHDFVETIEGLATYDGILVSCSEAGDGDAHRSSKNVNGEGIEIIDEVEASSPSSLEDLSWKLHANSNREGFLSIETISSEVHL